MVGSVLGRTYPLRKKPLALIVLVFFLGVVQEERGGD